MLRLLGILSLGNLLFGGHGRRALRRGLLFGLILGYLADKDFDLGRAEEEIREKARNARETARKAVKAARKEIRDARKAEHERRTAERVKTIREDAAARKAARDRQLEERMNAVRAEIENREARREQKKSAAAAETQGEPVPAGDEARMNRELLEDLERNARTAAMAASVPTIQFPEDDEKYYSSGKYGYA